MAFKSFKKYASKGRKLVRQVAKKAVDARRKYGIVKRGKISSMGVTKALANLRARVNTAAEYKLLDHAHTAGSPDVSLRQFYPLGASANQATLGDTTTPGTRGYLNIAVNMPTRGDGSNNFDGNRYNVSSIQWKGTLYASSSMDSYVKLMIVAYSDEDMDAFQMTEFLIPDNNGEYSIQCKRNFDYKGYKVIASKTIKLANGTGLRKDFNIIARPNQVIRHFQTDDAIKTTRYYLVALTSGDIGTVVQNVNYQGNTRMRFIA